MKRMRTRTHYCSHGFQVPGPPEPWTIPASKGGAEIKASRFCLQCWETHGQSFLAFGFPRIGTEDRCLYGFLDLIQYVLKDHAYHRDQDHYEFLETELRMHLLEKRDHIEKVIRETPSKVDAYVRVALRNKLVDLQRDDCSEHQIEKHSDSLLAGCSAESVQGNENDFDPNDGNERDAAIMEAIENGSDDHCDVEHARNRVAERIIETQCGEVRFNKAGVPISLKPDPKDPISQFKKKTAKQKNAELVREAIEEQGHRIDALTELTQKEVNKALKQLLTAVNSLPHDEQTVIRLRFLDGNELRDGRPRPRPDIIRELRISGNGVSQWSEWDLRRLEQQAVIRLRGKVSLPAVFQDRD